MVCRVFGECGSGLVRVGFHWMQIGPHEKQYTANDRADGSDSAFAARQLYPPRRLIAPALRSCGQVLTGRHMHLSAGTAEDPRDETASVPGVPLVRSPELRFEQFLFRPCLNRR